jgi:hypothetical protein
VATNGALSAYFADAGAAELDPFDEGAWGEKYPAVTASWRRRWEEVIPFFAFSPEVRLLDRKRTLLGSNWYGNRGAGHFYFPQRAEPTSNPCRAICLRQCAVSLK